MSRLGDYRDDMPLPQLSDYEIESILSGASLQRSDARDLEAFVGALAMTVRLEQRRPDMSRLLAETARMARPESVSHLWSRAAVLAATLGLVTTLGGVAVAANGAVPGDLLYPIDRALEVVGIGHTGVDERIAEIDTLIARDDAEMADALLEDILDSTDVDTESAGVTPAQAPDDSDDSMNSSTLGATVGDDSEPTDDRSDPGIGSTPSNGNGDAQGKPGHAGVPGQGSPHPGNSDQGGGSGSGNSEQDNGNSGSPPNQGNGNQEFPPGQGNGSQGSGTGNQGSQGEGTGNQGSQGSPPDQGNGNQANQGKGQD